MDVYEISGLEIFLTILIGIIVLIIFLPLLVIFLPLYLFVKLIAELVYQIGRLFK